VSKGNEPAYPLAWTDIHGDDQREYGLTKREEFAKAALQGLLSNVAGRCPHTEWSYLVPEAVSLADALLRELSKAPDGPEAVRNG
jgi:hypothetical protein